MSTKEKLRPGGARARDGLRSAAVVRGSEWVIRFLLGAVLSGAEVMGGAAPFGLGFVAASGPGVGGFSALLGVCFGYICFCGLTASLRYLAAAILIFSVSFAFYDLRIYRKAFFMPAAAALFTACTGFVYLAAGEWTGRLAVIFGSEILFTAAAAYFYRVAFTSWDRQEERTELLLPQLVSLLILGGTILIALSRLTLPGDISVGRLAACTAVMALAFLGGPGYGAAGGIAAGLAMDLAVSGLPFYGMAYSFSGLMAGVFHKQGKLFSALSYVLANAVAVLWTWDTGVHLPLLYEVFIGSVLFLLLPDRALRRVGVLLSGRQTVVETGAARLAQAKRQLTGAAEAFREVCRSIRPTLRDTNNDGDAVHIFDQAANRVCKTCSLREGCWQRDYQTTREACNHALPALLDRGRCSAADFPSHFSARCVKLPAFLSAVNEALTAVLAQRRYSGRLRESRRAVCRQYEDLAGILGSAAAEVSAELTPDTARARRLRAHLQAMNLDGEAAVFYDEAQRLRAEVEGRGLSVLADEAASGKLAAVLGVPLGEPDIEETVKGTRLTFSQAEPYMAVAGVAARQRDGETTSGDAGTWFKLPDGTLFFLLCDGMGSGEAALAESSLAVRLLEKLLRAGIAPEAALRTLNSAMALRDEAAGGFSTVDLLAVNLFSGESAVYKFGAAPTYLKKRGVISKLSGASLPAGLMDGDGVSPDIARFQVAPGDCVVLLSDGVTADGDEDVRRRLAAFDGVSPKALACALITGEATDDRTAIVLYIKER